MPQESQKDFPMAPGKVRGLFVAGHFVLPVVACVLIAAHVRWYLELSWQLLIIVGVGLIPVLLPLLAAYVSEGFGLKMKPLQTTGEARPVTGELQAAAATHSPLPFQLPAITGIGEEELRIIRTLALGQKRHESNGGTGVWGFNVPRDHPHYNEFERGARALSERGLVFWDKTPLLFLTLPGLEFCRLNADHPLMTKGPSWILANEKAG